MTNSQLSIAIGAPIAVVVIGFIWQGKGLDYLRAETNARFDAVNARLDMLTCGQERIDDDLKTFHRLIHDIDKRVDKLERA